MGTISPASWLVLMVVAGVTSGVISALVVRHLSLKIAEKEVLAKSQECPYLGKYQFAC